MGGMLGRFDFIKPFATPSFLYVTVLYISRPVLHDGFTLVSNRIGLLSRRCLRGKQGSKTKPHGGTMYDEQCESKWV